MSASYCTDRGYCGPFFDRERFDAAPDALWHGMGTCVWCRSTKTVADEDAKRAALTAADCAPVIGRAA